MPTYRGYGPREGNLPLVKGKINFADTAGMAAVFALIGDAEMPPVSDTAAVPFVGLTTDGVPRAGLYELDDEGVDTAAAARAARSYLDGLSGDLRTRAALPIHVPEWQMWSNAFLDFPEHGILLEDVSDRDRQAALDVIAATMSPAGFAGVREAMRLNGVLGQFLGQYPDTLTEWCYWFTIFGTPSGDEPWGWQIAGHHVDLNCLVLGRQVVITPTFLGAEFHGEDIFGDHRRLGLEFANSLRADQRNRAVLYPSMRSADLPHALGGPVDGRHRTGAGRDNIVLPYEGIPGDALTRGQRELLLRVFDPYLSAWPTGTAEARRTQIVRHLDECWFAWIGDTSDQEPFYYKIHSPVILVEYDNHPGIFIDNDEPEPFHVHTLVRTPNGGDYGKDLLSQHYARHH